MLTDVEVLPAAIVTLPLEATKSIPAIAVALAVVQSIVTGTWSGSDRANVIEADPSASETVVVDPETVGGMINVRPIYVETPSLAVSSISYASVTSGVNVGDASEAEERDATDPQGLRVMRQEYVVAAPENPS